MNPITPPTDNLYKFVALSGLVIIIFSVAYSSTALRETLNEAFKLEEESAILGLEIEDLAIDIKRLVEKYNDFQAKPDSILILEILRGKADEDLRSLGLEKNESLRIAREHAKKITILRIRGEKHQLLVDELTWIISLRRIGIILGALLAAVGFRLWYSRYQVYQDVQLKNAAKDMNISSYEVSS